MENVLEKLEQVLHSECTVHDEFLGSAQEFNKVIREQDLAAIDRQRAVHDATICRIEKLESERIACCRVLAGSLGINREPLKMSMLLEKIPTRWRERLHTLQETLKLKIAELSQISTSNRILLEEGLRVVQTTYSYVQQAVGNRYAPYGKHGRTIISAAPQNIINRTA
jgi:hypothetical protein